MYYRYFGSDSSPIMHFYTFTGSDNNLSHLYSSYLFNYEFYVSMGNYGISIEFYNVGGMEDTAGMDALFYLHTEIDDYEVTYQLPNADIPSFTLDCSLSVNLNADLVISVGYTSSYFNDFSGDSYSEGYNNGYQKGYYDGGEGVNQSMWRDGYETGLRDGYDQGVNSENDFTGVFGLIGSAFNSASSLYHISVIGGITIGTFFVIPLSLVIITSIFRLIRK